MKKKIIVGLLMIGMCVPMMACSNKQVFDTTYSYERAILSLPDGTIVEGKVTSWTDYEDGDQIQVTINKKTYLVHSTNIVLISE